MTGETSGACRCRGLKPRAASKITSAAFSRTSRGRRSFIFVIIIIRSRCERAAQMQDNYSCNCATHFLTATQFSLVVSDSFAGRVSCDEGICPRLNRFLDNNEIPPRHGSIRCTGLCLHTQCRLVGSICCRFFFCSLLVICC